MAAVAEYQRRTDLQVTGAVDLATARALGVVDDPDAASAATVPDADDVAAPAEVVPRPEPATTPASEPSDRGAGVPWWLVAAVVVAASVLAVVARRRSVVVKRAAHRRRRVHPSLSPHRSVADLRRAGAADREEIDVAVGPPS
jgi:hypothetical protein